MAFRTSLMTNRPIAVFSLILGLWGCTSAPPPEPPKPLVESRPNIVLILADDLSFRDLSIYGQQRYETPRLDALAAAGVRFTQAYAGAPECAPSRGTLMTGLHTGHAPIRANSSARGQDHLPDESVTIAEALKAAGYATGFSGKWGIGLPGTPGVPYMQGFDYSFGFYDQRRAHTYFPTYLYENDKRVEYPGNIGFDLQRLYDLNVPEPDPARLNQYDGDGSLVLDDVADPSQAVYSHAAIEKKALTFIDNHYQEPFFLYFAPQLPHGPPIVDELGPLATRDDFPHQMQKEWAAMVQRLDRSVGAIVDTLQRHGIYDNTLIAFASDNGYAMCGYLGRGNAQTNWPDDPFLRNKGPFRGGKFAPLEGGTRIAFFITWEGKIEPGAAAQPVSLVDLFPTINALTGAVGPANLDGANLLPLLTGAPTEFPQERALYWEKRREQAIRKGPWKAYRRSPDDDTELFLIEEDLSCERDLAPLYPHVVAEMERLFDESRTDHPWYWNPQETAEEFQAKRRRAQELNELQYDRVGNTPAPTD